MKTFTCKKHGETTKFYLTAERGARCTLCANEAKKKVRRKGKTRAIEYKGGKCSKCGYNKCMSALQFHHLDSSQKDFNISEKGINRSWDKIKKELDKCVLLCGNCHAETHEEQNIAP